MKHGAERLHKKIEDHIRALIKSSELKAGDCLPPERVLARRFKSSHIPVRQAVRALVGQNILEKIPNKGTFVKKTESRRTQTAKLAVLYHFHDEALSESPFYAGIFSGINAQAQKEERMLLVRRLLQEPGHVFHELHDEVDGFILLDPSRELLAVIDRPLRNAGKPVVVLNYEGELEGIDQVVFDSYANTVRLIEFLVDLGHRNIGYIYKEGIIFDEKTNPNQLNRISAYRDTLRRRGLAIDRAKELCLPRTNEMELLARFLREAQPPTALVCSNDHEAMRMCRMARELGIDVPRQLSVVGYDGIPEGATAWPPLTTIATPLQEMGRRGVNVLLEKQRNPGQLPARLVLPGVLVQRGSHAPLQS